MAGRVKAKDGGFVLTLGGVPCESFDFFINYRGNRLGLRRGAVHVDAVRSRAEGQDAFGVWNEQALAVVQPANFIAGFRIIVRHYAQADLAVLHIENDCEDAMFDTDVVAGLSLDLPAAGRGYITHLFMHEFSSLPPGYFFCTSTFSTSFPTDYGDLDWGNFALCEVGNRRYCALLPANASGMGARLAVTEGRIGFLSTALDSNGIYNRIPLGIVATGRDPYRLVKDVSRAAQQACDCSFGLREEKEFPETFKRLGWCSWNAFGQAVTADDLLRTAARMRELALPVGYFLIDDGWQSVSENKMTGFDANEKFPGGLAQVTYKLKNDYGLRNVGVWHTLQGYWGGIDPSAGEFAHDPEWFWYGRNKCHCPNPLDEHGMNFMAQWYRRLRYWGIDFVKVDNQGAFREYFYNMLPQDEAMGKMQANLQNAAKDACLPIINCMGQHPECYYHYYWSQAARVNADFIPEGDTPSGKTLDLARRHLQDSLYNSLWLQEIVYPDYDMFQTHHSAARCFAALNAISGGPLYITDDPEKMDPDLLYKLMNEDGTLLRADEPARPCIECLTVEPMSGSVPLAAFAPVNEGCVVVAINIGPEKKSLRFSLGLKGLRMPPAPRYAIYSHYAGKLAAATSAQAITGELEQMQVEVFSVVPMRRRFAAVGLIDRLVSPAAIASVHRSGNEVRIGLTSSGMFGAYVGGEVKSVLCGREEAARVNRMPQPGQYSVKGELLRVNAPTRDIAVVIQ